MHADCIPSTVVDHPEDDTFDLFADEPPCELHERQWTPVEVGGAGAVTSLLVEPQHGVVWDSALLVSKWLLERPELCRGRRCAEERHGEAQTLDSQISLCCH